MSVTCRAQRNFTCRVPGSDKNANGHIALDLPLVGLELVRAPMLPHELVLLLRFKARRSFHRLTSQHTHKSIEHELPGNSNETKVLKLEDMHTNIHACCMMHTYMHYIHTNKQNENTKKTHTHTHTHAFMHTWVRAYVRRYVRTTYMQSLSACMQACMHT